MNVDGQETRVGTGGITFTPKVVPHAFIVVSEAARVLTFQTPGIGQAFYRGASEPATGDTSDTVDIPPSKRGRKRTLAASSSSGHRPSKRSRSADDEPHHRLRDRPFPERLVEVRQRRRRLRPSLWLTDDHGNGGRDDTATKAQREGHALSCVLLSCVLCG